jgi:type II secretory pathway component PulF
MGLDTIFSLFKKVYSKIGLEIIGIITIILAIQEVFKINLNLDLIIYVLVILIFIDAAIKIGMGYIETVRIRWTATSKKIEEYTIKELDAETATVIQEGITLATDIKNQIEVAKKNKDEAKLADLEAQLAELEK